MEKAENFFVCLQLVFEFYAVKATLKKKAKEKNIISSSMYICLVHIDLFLVVYA